MKKLKDRIVQDGRILPGDILKVDSFLNHQMDPELLMEIALCFKEKFKNIEANKIVTIEASGIAPAVIQESVSQKMCPLFSLSEAKLV